MPPASKSLAKKIQVTPLQTRPKGAVRAKSGCYTCRIRRKKCDERRVGDETGPCETCMRLKLECLGFGAKRPDWMRDVNVISAIRDRIKECLASRGMIKGHAGSGSRMQDPDEFLKLSDIRSMLTEPREYQSGSSSSGREDSVESEQFFPYQQSSVRAVEYGQDLLSSPCESPMDQQVQYQYLPNFEYTNISMRDFDSPATSSRFSTLYHAHYTIDPEPEPEFDPMNPSPSAIMPANILPDYLIHDSVRQYVENIVGIQYLLGDKVVLPKMIWEAVNQHFPSKEAVSLLSLSYHSREADQHPTILLDPMVQLRVSRVKEILSHPEGRFTADDAMAALHIVSLFLFDGGHGKWNEFLAFACSYTIGLLEDCRFGSYPDALEAANRKDEFVIKTTIWFDVLASITLQKPPRLLGYIRQLFHPDVSWSRKYSMLSPMGCENAVVWALAETSNLAYIKTQAEKKGSLSIRQLVNQVQQIEPCLLPGPRPIEPRYGPEGWARYITSEIFRTSTKLFLKSVESGDHPHVPEIQSCVNDTFSTILSVAPNGSGLNDSEASAVIRNTVFAFYICGSLADSEQILRELQTKLTQKSDHKGYGNTATISGMLTELWDERRLRMPGQPVRWRKLLRRKGVLLV